MELKWIFPKLKYGFNPPAIYRFDFDNGNFYIGSSMSVKKRWTIWKTNLKRNVFQSKLMADSIKNATEVKVSIIEIFDNDIDEKTLKEKETVYLRLNFDNKLFLNMSPNAFTNEGLKPIPDYLKRPKRELPKKKYYKLKGKFKPDRKYVWSYSKPIIQLSIDGKFIRSHKSIADAARSICVNESTIQGHIRCRRVYGIGGFIFREIGGIEDFEIIKKKIKEKPTIILRGGTKPVIDLNTGVFYYSAREVSNLMGIKEKKLYKMLNGERTNTTSYRYA